MRTGRYSAPSTFLNTMHVLWPPKPNAFESATVTSRSCGALNV